MRILLVLILLISPLLSLRAQQSEVRAVGSFKGVKAARAVDVYLKQGTRESVKVEVTGVPLTAVVTEVVGTWLKVQLGNGDYNNHKTVKVYVTYVTLEKLSASSASNIFSEGPIKSAEMEIAAYSAASVEIALEATSVRAESASAGDIVLEGKAANLTAETSSAGVVDAYKLECENVNVSASSAGEAKVNVTKGLVANANSGGSIHYRGNPSKTITNANSGGSVKKSN